MTDVNSVKLTNQVTLYSNGIGHFRRSYEIPVGDGRKISIPFKSDHIADVLSSLSVFGSVKLASPPSFTPTNANATSLQINNLNAMKDLLSNLSGAAIALQIQGSGDDYKFTLLGLDTKQKVVNQEVVTEYYVIVSNDDGFYRYSLDSIRKLTFLEEAVQAEIAKALQQNFQKIKPDSTFLDLELSVLGENSEIAMVQYIVPVATWKIRYNIRSDKGAYYLEGTAIIDNNTNEDWDNFIISVVTGNPISFSTDLATITVPVRQHVNVVDSNAQGYVHHEAAIARSPIGGARAMKSMNRVYNTASCASFGTLEAACDDEIGGYENSAGPAAVSAGADSKDVGDFCIFTCKDPIRVASKRSALVPLFVVPLTTAGTLLIYKENENSRRPFRALKFRNESSVSLGRGKVTIYQDGVLQGESMIEVTKPGEQRMLSHCIENGVKITKAIGSIEQKQTSLQITAGTCIEEVVSTSTTTYDIENRKDEEFKVGIEHQCRLSKTDTRKVNTVSELEILQTEELENGARFYFNLAPKQAAKLVVVETLVQSQKIAINGYRALQRMITDVKHPLADDTNVKVCIELQEQIDEIIASISEAQNKISVLTNQAQSTRNNLVAVTNSNEATIQKWVAKLEQIETETEALNLTTIPQLQVSQKDLAKQLAKALKSLSVSWKV